ncbi:hypothetical protein GORBP_016_00090 [Gordonia rubripertincta NBRC 101908]|uniref:Uncharacterized protein n=1 Tax=Gordonia rubripertincta NBRC 101908 TaxID=1077975 RepID=A0ABQ0HNJ4_GORRU|nr:hypothetical protein GORBP_016_00090 [Gordonia rubripertincta NBRC 101908]
MTLACRLDSVIFAPIVITADDDGITSAYSSGGDDGLPGRGKEWLEPGLRLMSFEWWTESCPIFATVSDA